MRTEGGILRDMPSRRPMQRGGSGGGGVEVYAVAAFRVDEVSSISYRKLHTMKGLLTHLERLISEKRPDYISLRVIRA